MTTDRLTEIEEHYQHCWATEVPHAFDPGSGHLDDVEWLIAEVKLWKARALNREAEVESLEAKAAGDDIAIDILRTENERLQEERAKRDADFEPLLDEILRLRAHIEKGHTLVNDMDLRMPEQATEDAEGWINSYRIPVGPWHRLLGWARGGLADLSTVSSTKP